MALSKDDILNAIAEMSVMDIVELIEAMEEKFGVTAAAAVAAGTIWLVRSRRGSRTTEVGLNPAGIEIRGSFIRTFRVKSFKRGPSILFKIHGELVPRPMASNEDQKEEG